MKKKITIIILTITVIIGASLLYCKVAYKKDVQTNNKTMAVYVEGDTEGEYEVYDSNKFPTDGYVLNTEKSYCENGSVLSQNEETKTIGINVTKSDKCKLYFDKVKVLTSEDTLNYMGLTVKSGSPDFSKASPGFTGYTDTNFNAGLSSTSASNSYYYTYASSYTFDSSTGKYTLVNPSVGKYSSIYSNLSGKYIVDPNGSSSSSKASYTDLRYIYQVQSSTTSSQLYYIISTKTGNFTDESETGIWSMEDDYGTSYYFRGNVTNNYVKFGKWTDEIYYGYYSSDSTYYKTYSSLTECQNSSSYNSNCQVGISAGTDMYWRIIRINGDGTVRIIYDGTTTHKNGDADYDRVILTNVVWNSNNDDAKYVGYMYGGEEGTASTSLDEALKNETNSNIKTVLEEWYTNNIESKYTTTKLNEMIANEVFCNDRSKSSGVGYGKNYTYYSAYHRTTAPSLNCNSQEGDIFTTSETSGIIKGNGKLNKPIGTLTLDEAILAGGKLWKSNDGDDDNNKYYLYKGIWYWTMSPNTYYNWASVFNINSGGSVAGTNMVNYDMGVAPVINLTAEYFNTMSGDGTATNPYTAE